MRPITIKKLAIYTLAVLLLYGGKAAAANNILAPHDTYKGRYVFVPGTPGSYGYWGKSAITPEEAWNQSPNLHFQSFIGGIASSVGSAVASGLSTAASAVGSAVGAVVSQAGGIASLATKVVPFAAGLTKDLVMQQLAANNAAAQSNAENKAATGRLIIQTEAEKEKAKIEAEKEKAIAKQQAETALEIAKMNAEAEKEKAKTQAEKEKEIAKTQAEKEKEIARTQAGAKKPETEVSKTAEVEKKKFQEIAKKDVTADKELKAKVDDLVKATNTVKEVVQEKVGVAATTPKSGTAPTALLSPKISSGTQFSAETMEMPAEFSGTAPKGGKMTAEKFQKEALNEAKTEKLIGEVAEKIYKESQVFVEALNKLVEARASGLEAKDLGAQIKAVDASWDKLLKLYAKNEEAAKDYGQQISELEAINFDNDAELDLLIGEGDEPDQLVKYTKEQLDATLEKEVEEALNQLEAQLDELDKELTKLEAVDAEQGNQ